MVVEGVCGLVADGVVHDFRGVVEREVQLEYAVAALR